MIIVTGGAGLIGSNLVKALNARGERDILVVDHLSNGRKIVNLSDLDFSDYVERDDFLHRLESGAIGQGVRAVLHQGACSATTEWDGRYMMRNNYDYSKRLLAWCQQAGVPFIYASSASVYGQGAKGFSETREAEHPINAYAFSKFQFDQYVRQLLPSARAQLVGLRYFNVYGPREAHKGSMASTTWHFTRQLQEDGKARLFGAWGGIEAGEQRRDFVFVEDCAAVNLWFLDHPEVSGIFNCGTGQARSFMDMAKAILKARGSGEIAFIDFPEHLKGAYQSYTQADLAALRAAGCTVQFHSLEEGVAKYVAWLGEDADRLKPAVPPTR